MRPEIVCLCGSTRFYDEFQQSNYDETMRGNIVLTVGFYPFASHRTGAKFVTELEKQKLDYLHLHKIDLATRVRFLNVDGYMGESTTRELAYAVMTRKSIDWHNRVAGEQWMIRERHMLGAMVAAMVDGAPHDAGNGGVVWQRLVDIWQAHRPAESAAAG